MHKTFDLLHKEELIKSMLKLYVKSFFFLGGCFKYEKSINKFEIYNSVSGFFGFKF